MNFAFFDAKSYEIPYFEKHARGAGISFKYFDTRLDEDTVRLAEGFDGVCVFSDDTLSAKVIDKLAGYGIKTVALRCTGFNNVDMKHAFGKIRVVRIPHYSHRSVAEHAAAMLLSLVRKIPKANSRTKDHNFDLSGLCGTLLYGKTVGIIGTGRIGGAFADICMGLGMRVLAYDKFKSQEMISGGRVKYVKADELIAESDVISLHCPLKEETYHIIGERALSLCKRGVIILNTSREGLIDTDALIDAVKRGQVGGVCLDIYEEEIEKFKKHRAGHVSEGDALARLISMPSVLATAHQGYLTEENLDAVAEVTVKNITELKETNKCKNELC